MHLHDSLKDSYPYGPCIYERYNIVNFVESRLKGMHTWGWVLSAPQRWICPFILSRSLPYLRSNIIYIFKIRLVVEEYRAVYVGYNND